MNNSEQAFETWWSTQVVPADDQRDWSQPIDEEFNRQVKAMAEVSKMWARKGWMAALGDGGKGE